MTTETSHTAFEDPELTDLEREYAEDSACVAALQAGDVQAFVPVVQRYFPRLRDRMIRSVGHHEAEELAQEALTKAFAALQDGKFVDNGYGLGPWLHRICTNNLLSGVRRSKIKRMIPVPNEDFDTFARSADASEAIFDGQDTVNQLLDVLPTNFRDVFEAVGMEGVGYEAYAQQHDLPVGTVASRLHRARKMLARHPALADIRQSLPSDKSADL